MVTAPNQHLKRTQNRLSVDYLRVIMVVLGAMVIFSIGFSFTIYQQNQEKHQKTNEKAASEARTIIQEILHEVAHVMKYVGNEIKNDDPNDIAKIANRLSAVKSVNNFVDSLLRIDWIEKSNKMVASNVCGVFAVPKEVKNRRYLEEAPKKPWSLVLCEPALGTTSGVWIIPFGMGIASDKGEYLGTLTLGININAITRKIRQALNVFNADFIVLDAEKKVIFQSFNEKEFESLPIGEKLFQHFQCLEPNDEVSPGVLELRKHFFYTCQKIPEAGYYIFTGFDKQYVQNVYFISFFPLIMQLGVFSFLSLVILLIFWKRHIYPIVHLSELTNQLSYGNTELDIPAQYLPQELSLLAQSLHRLLHYVKESKNKLFQLKEFTSDQLNLEKAIKRLVDADKIREKFFKLFNSKLEKTSDEILASAYILMDDWHNHLDISLSMEQQLSFLNKIHQGIGALITLSTNELQLVEVEVELCVKECIAIQYPKAFTGSISIHLKIEKPIPSLYLDELIFKQILMGLLSRAIRYTPNNGKIEIEVYGASVNNNRVLNLFINDSGFGLAENDIDRLENKFATASAFSDPTAMELDRIQDLVQLHCAALTIEPKWNKGTATTLCIPYGLEKRVHDLGASATLSHALAQ